jgi:hypothetical protein
VLALQLRVFLRLNRSPLVSFTQRSPKLGFTLPEVLNSFRLEVECAQQIGDFLTPLLDRQPTRSLVFVARFGETRPSTGGSENASVFSSFSAFLLRRRQAEYHSLTIVLAIIA